MADVADKQKIAPKTHKLELRAGQQQLVRAEAHVRYEVVDARTGHKPQQLKARRIGDNLELFTEDAAELATQAAAPQAQVVVEGYFSQPDVLLVAGSGEGAGSYAVTQEVTTNAFTTVGVLENAGALIPAAPFFSPLTTALAGAAGLAAVASTTDKTNSAPTIIAGTQSVQLVEAGGENNATTGTSAATVALTKADVDGTASFDTSWLSSNGWSTADSGATYTKAGTYGTATLTISTGVVSYALDNTKSATQALTASQAVSDSFAVQVTDGTATASANAVFNITGTNDAASISGTSTGSVTEDGTLTASGTLTITDADIGESVFLSPTSLKGDYGMFIFYEQTGQWTYQVDNQAIQGLRSGYELQDKLTVRSKDGSASHDIVVTIFGADDQALIDVVIDAKGSDQSNVDVVESVDHTRPSVSGTLTVGTMDYGDRIVVKGVKFNAAQSSSLEGTGLTAADIETGFLNSLSLTEITDNGGVHNLNWAFYTNGTLPKDFKLVLDYTLASVNSNGFFDTNGMPVGDTVDEQVLTIATTGVNSVVTVSKQGADAEALSVTETNGLVESPVHSLTVNEWDYGDLINVAVQSAKVDLPKTNFLTETTPGLAAFESYIKSWLQVELGDLAGTSNLKWKFATIYADDLDFVPANSKLVIDYTLAISENGQPATTQNIEITIDGVNDAPVYELQTRDTIKAALDLKADTAIQKASGTLSPYDADFADSISHEVKDVSWNARSQGITQEQFDTWKLTLKDLLTIDIGPDYGMSHSLTWYFNQAGADIKSAMPTGSTLSMDYTLRVTDALGAWSDQKIHIDLYA